MTHRSMWQRARATLEFLGGVTDAPGDGVPRALGGAVVTGVWWCALLLLILAFSGQASKFIYIDF